MRSRLVSAATVAIFSVALAPLTAQADSPDPVVINAHPCQFAPVEIGPWEATGAISDSGTYARTEVASSPPGATFFTARTVREEFLFTSSLGTFVVHAEERASGPGVWQIDGGTGAYARTSGHGDTAFFQTPTPNSCPFGFMNFTFSLAGVASKVG
jgi:hypothetical protein